MKVALLLVVVAALAGPSFCQSGVPSIWIGPLQQSLNAAKARVEKAMTEVDTLLGKGDKEEAARVIDVAVLRMRRALENFLGLLEGISIVSPNIKDATSKAIAALDDLKAKAHEATYQDDIEEVKASINGGVSDVYSKIEEVVKQLRPRRLF